MDYEILAEQLSRKAFEHQLLVGDLIASGSKLGYAHATAGWILHDIASSVRSAIKKTKKEQQDRDAT